MHILDHSHKDTTFITKVFSTFHCCLPSKACLRSAYEQIHNLQPIHTHSSIDSLDHLISLIPFELRANRQSSLPRRRDLYHTIPSIELAHVFNNHSTCTSKREYGRRRSSSDVIQQLPFQQWVGYARFWLCLQTSKRQQYQASLIRAIEAIRPTRQWCSYASNIAISLACRFENCTKVCYF